MNAMLLPKPNIAAHLIVGARQEPFLAALLKSLEHVAETIIVNENSGLDETENLTVLHASHFYRNGKMTVVRSTFSDFASARNLCLDVHVDGTGIRPEWIAFVDADEVHGAIAQVIARKLALVPADINFVDGYTFHFLQSFSWYTSIERRMCFFRYRPQLRWSGAVHEHLSGLPERRLALPYVYAHYGHVLSAQRHAEKNIHYADLSDRGSVVHEQPLDKIDVETYFAAFWPKLLRFHGEHPPAARETITLLRQSMAEYYAKTEHYIAKHRGTPVDACVRTFWKVNYDIRWRSRYLNPLARMLCAEA